ncbi:MAG: hypothetical protein ACFB10_17850 [Salibacteraceae bacterium]
MSTSWYRPLQINYREKLKLFFLANDAPSSKKDLVVPNTYNTGYHKEIYDLLISIGVDVYSSHDISEVISANTSSNYVFSLFNRAEFENSEIFASTICEWQNLPYLGAKPNIRALAEDKHLAKILAKHLHIPTSPWKIYQKDAPCPQAPDFEGPYFIKWRYGASSKFVSADCIAQNWEEAKTIIKKFHRNNCDVIMEKLIKGKGVTVPVILGSDDSPVSLPPVITDSEMPYGIVTHDQARKREEGMSRRVLNNDSLYNELIEYSTKLFDSIRPIDYIRVDFKLDTEYSNPLFLEFNVCCNLSSTSAISLSASQIGLTQTELISHILQQSLTRQRFLR